MSDYPPRGLWGSVREYTPDTESVREAFIDSDYPGWGRDFDRWLDGVRDTAMREDWPVLSRGLRQLTHKADDCRDAAELAELLAAELDWVARRLGADRTETSCAR